MGTILDDMYDAFGTYEELTLFTDAMERWDIQMIHQLPQYMQVFYKALLDLYEEIERELDQNSTEYVIFYAKKAIQELARTYLVEEKWFKEGYTPPVEEYLQHALVSSCMKMLTIDSLLGMSDIATLKTFEWADSNPNIIKDSSIICRLMDDIISHKFEQERGHVASAVECYVKLHNHLVSEEEAYGNFRRKIENAWKDLNEACLEQVEESMEILIRILNFAQILDLLYKYEDGHTFVNGATKLHIKNLLIESLPM